MAGETNTGAAQFMEQAVIRMSEAAFKGLQQGDIAARSRQVSVQQECTKPRRKRKTSTALEVLGEAAVNKQIIDFARAHGFVCLRLQSGLFQRPGSSSRIRIGEKGLPDWLIIRKSWSTSRGFCRAAFIEIKAGGKRLRPDQQEWFEQHRAQGFVCEVFDSLSAFEDFYRRVLGPKE